MSITDKALRMIMVANIFSNADDGVQADDVQDAGYQISVKSPSGTKAGICGNPVAK